MDNVRQNILATLAYYDVLDLPLKQEEVYARMVNFKHITGRQPSAISYQPIHAEYLKKELDLLVLDRIINRAGEYYFLFDREYLAALRLKREKLAKRKWQKTRIAIRWLRFLPYVRAVFASGSLAINNTDELSDLDVLIVVRHGRIWLARLLITLLMSVLGVRRRASDTIAPDKICLNHYITDESLAIPFKSVYTAQTYANLVPIYMDNPALIDNFKKANCWVLDYVQSWNINSTGQVFRTWWPGRLRERLLEIFHLGIFFNNLARKYQARRISSNPVTNRSGGRVIFSDEQLEFHPHSVELSIIKKYNDNLIKLGLADLAVERDSGLAK